ncbi:receptor-like protein 7 [Castanea sativa]|uniref:receptor-like protein 7 n=1 Tax=Castanea sativa TaxID=21020 RepID=UPI003F64BBC4
MGSSVWPFMSKHLLLLLLIFHYLNSLSISTQPLCKDFESFALLQFKQSFAINVSASDDPSAYPKISSWKAEERNDCCSWDGVLCDRVTGHVIGLDLSSNYLYGSINPSSSLFHLVHLQKLNLADNDFNYSQIPPSIRYLSNLTYLNLSISVFSGQIPPEIFELSKLASLDLAFNRLKLHKPSLKGLVENLTSLKLLYLREVDISSPVPHILAHLSSLTNLDLGGCGLYGEFPSQIFKLPNLQVLFVGYNPNLTGYLPEFHTHSPLLSLMLKHTGFSGKLPDSIGNLKSLYKLNIAACYFSGLIPTSLGNLTNLINLRLASNNFRGQIPFSLTNLTQLSHLNLSYNAFSPQTLTWLGKQTKLTFLNLEAVNLYGAIPSFLKNMTQLAKLSLASNNLTGQIPSWLVNLTHITSLSLNDNQFTGTVNFGLFHKLKNLTHLQLSEVHLSFPINSTFEASFPKLKLLALVACNLTEIPNLLRYQDELEIVDLHRNKIGGQIPKWIFDMGKETLLGLDLSSNLITGFESFNNTPRVLQWGSLLTLCLGSNKLQGPLPIPPPSIALYTVTYNTLIGEISPLFCNLRSIVLLNLSHNNLSGMLPQCFSNLSEFLLILDLHNNNLHGTLPATYKEGCGLKLMDVSYNRLEGWVPRSLSNCKMLEILLLGNNRFGDIFPPWLGKLPMLRALSLRSNGFQGAIGKPESILEFPRLQIIDVSCNNFTGKLPSEYFQIWNSMKVSNASNLTYMKVIAWTTSVEYNWEFPFHYSIVMTNKGIQTEYEKIQGFLIAIDLSSNRFEGEISEVIGNLKGLHSLNLSNNILSGCIPSSLGNLTGLESLDLSQNKLSGEIPQRLLQLTFLGIFNVSNNHLIGPIPQGQQFSTFPNDSYLGNTELCGIPLTKKCKIHEPLTQPQPNSKQDEVLNFSSKSDWVVIMMGYGSGLIIGFVIGQNLTIRKLEWVFKNLRRQ